MTTIAYRNGVLAADSRAMLGGWKANYPLPKLFRLKSGSIVGVCGTYPRGLVFKDWLDGGCEGDRPDLDDSTVIEVRPDLTLICHEVVGSFSIVADYAAWGSGGPPATAALIVGASAKRAVEIAAMLDDSTGGEVHTMKVKG